jgi:hypothetical protein
MGEFLGNEVKDHIPTLEEIIMDNNIIFENIILTPFEKKLLLEVGGKAINMLRHTSQK